MDPTEDTEMDLSDQIVAEQVEVTHTIDITELVTGIPEVNAEQTTRTSSQKDTQIPQNKQFHC